MPQIEQAENSHSIPNFAEIVWTQAEFFDDEETAVSEMQKPFSFEGQSMSLYGMKTSHKDQDIYKFVARRLDSEIRFGLDITTLQDNMAIAETSIQRDDKAKKLPKGLGLELYKNILAYIQSAANQKNILVRHYVTKAPGISNTPLTEQRWDELFMPILVSNGYEERETEWGKKWVKDYEPLAE